MEGNENTQRKPTAAPFPTCDGAGIKPNASLFVLNALNAGVNYRCDH